MKYQATVRIAVRRWMEINMNLIDRDKLLKTIPSEETVARMAVMSAPTVDAVPVSYIQDRIDSLQELKQYEMEASGFIGQIHTEVYALRRLINYWKEERNKQNEHDA